MPVISSGNICICSCGTSFIRLKAFNTSVNVEGSAIVGNTDTPKLGTFIMCKSKTNPAVISAIALSGGQVKEAPCKSMIITNWSNTKSNVLACGKPVCISGATCRCANGGIISIVNIKNHTVL